MTTGSSSSLGLTETGTSPAVGADNPNRDKGPNVAAEGGLAARTEQVKEQGALSLSWGAPPPSNYGPPSVWAPRFIAAMERPGEWASLEMAATAAHAFYNTFKTHSGRLGGRWEYTTRGSSAKNNGAKARVYFRYIGPDTVAETVK